MGVPVCALIVGLFAVLANGRGDGRLSLEDFGNGGPAVPRHAAYLGATVWPEQVTQQGRIDVTREFEENIGTKLAILHVYVRWKTELATPSTLEYVRSGHDLLVSWATADIRKIANGEEDSGIVSMAEQVKRLGVPIFLEPRWEMDRPNLHSVVHSAKDFVAAWNHIRQVFAAHDVTNASWVWCPTAQGFVTKTAQAYYPGDDAVDWVCVDAYPMHSYIPDTYEPLSGLLDAFMAWASHHDKPVMIGEFGVPKSYGARRAQWLQDAADYVRSKPQIKALVYFDGPAEPSSPNRDYRLQSGESATRAFAALARSDYFRGAR